MDTVYIFLIFFYGQLCGLLSTETQMPPTTLLSNIFLKQSRNTSVSLGGKKGNPAPMFLYQSNELGNLEKNVKNQSAATMMPHTTAAEKRELNDGSWIAALIIGIILTSMIIACIIILLWKCSKKSAPINPNWAGRSPFADGETPDAFMENIKEVEQTTKRTSVLSILPWKFNKNSVLLDNAEGSESNKGPEKTSSCSTEDESNQSTPTIKGDSGLLAVNISVSLSNSTNVTPPSSSDGSSDVCNPSDNQVLPPPESPDLPPPPDWLNEVQENHNLEINESPELKSEAQSQFSLSPNHENVNLSLPLPPPPLPQ